MQGMSYGNAMLVQPRVKKSVTVSFQQESSGELHPCMTPLFQTLTLTLLCRVEVASGLFPSLLLSSILQGTHP
jgi:hypothetical protein